MLNCVRQVWVGSARLARDQGGGVLVSLAVALPVLVGVTLLAVDASRLYNLSTSLQSGADALALAGAAELDRRPDAIARATAAINAMVANQHTFANSGPATIRTSSIRFLKSLPASDGSAIRDADVTSDPEQARFVEVTVQPQTLSTLLPASFLGQSGTAQATARAVAGMTLATCMVTPLFICNPYENEASIWDVVADPAMRRRQIKLQVGPGGGMAQYFPGNFGWLETASSGATALRDALALVRPNTCYSQNGIYVKTGNISNADDALNTRFDLWRGPFNSESGNASYRPALNVRKGYVAGKGKGGACNPSPTSPNTNALGRDSAFPYAGGRVGNGQWDFESYWANNFGGPRPNGWSNANLPSRYEVYRYEIENGLVGQAAVGGNAAGETGSPACYSGGGVSDTPDRRVIVGAIVDCEELNIHGSSGGPLQVRAFGKFFLTEPVPKNPDPDAGTIFAELIGLAEPGTDKDIVRDIVQLYR